MGSLSQKLGVRREIANTLQARKQKKSRERMIESVGARSTSFGIELPGVRWRAERMELCVINTSPKNENVMVQWRTWEWLLLWDAGDLHSSVYRRPLGRIHKVMTKRDVMIQWLVGRDGAVQWMRLISVMIVARSCVCAILVGCVLLNNCLRDSWWYTWFWW